MIAGTKVYHPKAKIAGVVSIAKDGSLKVNAGALPKRTRHFAATLEGWLVDDRPVQASEAVEYTLADTEAIKEAELLRADQIAAIIDQVCDLVAAATGSRPVRSGLSQSRYFEGESGYRVRISDHAARPSYEVLNGVADFTVCVGGSDPEAAIHLSLDASKEEIGLAADMVSARLSR